MNHKETKTQNNIDIAYKIGRCGGNSIQLIRRYKTPSNHLFRNTINQILAEKITHKLLVQLNYLSTLPVM